MDDFDDFDFDDLYDEEDIYEEFWLVRPKTYKGIQVAVQAVFDQLSKDKQSMASLGLDGNAIYEIFQEYEMALGLILQGLMEAAITDPKEVAEILDTDYEIRTTTSQDDDDEPPPHLH